MSFWRQASLAKMMSLGCKLTVLACHLTKKANKAPELTYLSTNIGASAFKVNSPACTTIGVKHMRSVSTILTQFISHPNTNTRLKLLVLDYFPGVLIAKKNVLKMTLGK